MHNALINITSQAAEKTIHHSFAVIAFSCYGPVPGIHEALKAVVGNLRPKQLDAEPFSDPAVDGPDENPCDS